MRRHLHNAAPRARSRRRAAEYLARTRSRPASCRSVRSPRRVNFELFPSLPAWGRGDWPCGEFLGRASIRLNMRCGAMACSVGGDHVAESVLCTITSTSCWPVLALSTLSTAGPGRDRDCTVEVGPLLPATFQSLVVADRIARAIKLQMIVPAAFSLSFPSLWAGNTEHQSRGRGNIGTARESDNSWQR